MMIFINKWLLEKNSGGLDRDSMQFLIETFNTFGLSLSLSLDLGLDLGLVSSRSILNF
jgi:hypothetical protein